MSASTDLIRILFVDDEPERLGGIIDLLHGVADVRTRMPLEVTDEDLVGIDLVSVDEYLGSDWESIVAATNGDLAVSLKNVDGLAVAASFRSQTRQSVRPSELNFAVTLHTADLAGLSAGLPEQNREALTAAQHDLDWVFDFAGLNSNEMRLVEMAQAVKSASAAATSLKEDFGTAWLGLPATEWASTAQDQIEDCRPPAHALAVSTRGRSYIRWLAQRVLPYPTFLVDDLHVAHLLGITPDSFQSLAGRVEERIDLARYKGPLATFVGARWWRAAWQQILVDAGANQWDPSAYRAERLSAAWGMALDPLSNDQPVITYDLNSRLLDIDVNADEAVRLHADGWPIYADDPWSLIHHVNEDSDLKRLVAQSDRYRLNAES